MKRAWIKASVTAVFLSCLPAPAFLAGQEPPPEAPAVETVNLYFDCQGFGCWDMDFFRREIPFVNWVRDRQSADVHVLVTTQATGGGGRRYALAFMGRGRFEGEAQELVVTTPGAATEDEVRRALAARLRLGLGRYLAGTAMAERLQLQLPPPPPGTGPGPAGVRPPGPAPGAQPPEDPWDFWVFTIRGNANLNGESSYSSSNLSTNFSANRTTEAWKINLSGRLSRNKQTFELASGAKVESKRDDWSASGLLVRSVTDRFSVGTRAGAGKSTFVNEDFRWNAAGGVEVNTFPYAESSRRSLTFQALLEVRHWDYVYPTIFGHEEETRLAGQLRSELGFNQPWGRASLSVEHSRYFHDAGKWSASLGGSVDIRLFKGFSVNVGGNYEWIRDQLYISARGITDEQVLTRQRALATNFSYFTSFGISYRFGSIFNNVVNPRFGGSSGGGGGMMLMMM